MILEFPTNSNIASATITPIQSPELSGSTTINTINITAEILHLHILVYEFSNDDIHYALNIVTNTYEIYVNSTNLPLLRYYLESISYNQSVKEKTLKKKFPEYFI